MSQCVQDIDLKESQNAVGAYNVRPTGCSTKAQRLVRSLAAVSKATLAPVSFPQVRKPSGIPGRQLHDCSIASQARRSPHTTNNTNLIFCCRGWRALLPILFLPREHLRQPPTD